MGVESFRVVPFFMSQNDGANTEISGTESSERQRNYEIFPLAEIPGFNATAIPLSDGNTLIISRIPLEQSIPWGEPDLNRVTTRTVRLSNRDLVPVVEANLTPDIHIEDQVILWDPQADVVPSATEPYICNLEDIRANNEGQCGLTVVEKNPITGGYTTFAGFFEHPKKMIPHLPQVEVLRSLGAGKNFTPIGKVIKGQETFLFRPEGDNFNHALQVVTYDKQTKNATVVDTLHFQKTNWSKSRMGTGAGLFWINETQAILPIHGINYEDSIYNYSIGVALLEKRANGKLEVVEVSDKPLINPNQLEDIAGDRIPGKRIVYTCGVWEENTDGQDSFNFLVNKGDQATLLARIPRATVLQSLNLTQTIELPQAA